MALLLDGFVSDIEDVVKVDSGVSEVARAEGINIDHKLALAQGDCQLRISQFVVNHGLESRLGTLNNVLRLDRVVVSDGLKRWFCLHTLQLFYSDAYYSVLNDRYGKRLENFRIQATEAWDAYTDTGIACVYDPIPRGQIARLDTNSIPIGAGTYYVAIAWLNSGGASGALSDVVAVSLDAGQGLVVVPANPPVGVTAFHVYIGTNERALWKQNETPLGAGGSYAASAVTIGSGEPPEPIQTIDFVLRKSRMFTRG